MSKMRVLLVGATAAGAFAAASFIPVHADQQDVGGGISVISSDGGTDPTSGYLVLNGDASAPVHGYIGVSGPDGGVVGCYGQNFDENFADDTATPPGPSNNVIIHIPPAEGEPGQPDPANPCVPHQG